MASELDNAVQAGLDILKNISGLRNKPDYSPENPASFPLLVGSAATGIWRKEAAGQKRGLHTVRFGIYVPRKDLSRDIEAVMPYGELAADLLMLDSNARWNDTIDSYEGDITYTFGEIEYAGLLLLGWTILVPVKIRSNQSGSAYVKG